MDHLKRKTANGDESIAKTQKVDSLGTRIKNQMSVELQKK